MQKFYLIYSFAFLLLKLGHGAPVTQEMIRAIESEDKIGGPEQQEFPVEIYVSGGDTEGGEFFMNPPNTEYFVSKEILGFNQDPESSQRAEIIPLRKSPEFIASFNEVIKKLEDENPEMFKEFRAESGLGPDVEIPKTLLQPPKLDEPEKVDEAKEEEKENVSDSVNLITPKEYSLEDIEKELEHFRINEVEGEFERRIKRKENGGVNPEDNKMKKSKGIEMNYERSLNSHKKYSKPRSSVEDEVEVRRLEKELENMLREFEEMTQSQSNSVQGEYFVEEFEKIRKTSVPSPRLFNIPTSSEFKMRPAKPSSNPARPMSVNIKTKSSAKMSKKFSSALKEKMMRGDMQAEESNSVPFSFPPFPKSSLTPPHRPFKIPSSEMDSSPAASEKVEKEIPPQILILGNFPSSPKSNSFWENFFRKALEQNKVPKELKISFVPANILLARKKF